MVDQNVVVTSGTQHAVNGFAELGMLGVETVICFCFRAGHSHFVFYLTISILADSQNNRGGKVPETFSRFRDEMQVLLPPRHSTFA